MGNPGSGPVLLLPPEFLVRLQQILSSALFFPTSALQHFRHPLEGCKLARSVVPSDVTPHTCEFTSVPKHVSKAKWGLWIVCRHREEARRLGSQWVLGQGPHLGRACSQGRPGADPWGNPRRQRGRKRYIYSSLNVSRTALLSIFILGRWKQLCCSGPSADQPFGAIVTSHLLREALALYGDLCHVQEDVLHNMSAYGCSALYCSAKWPSFP